jgi:hypothetical protein
LITSDPEVWKRFLAVRSPYRRADWYIGMRFDPSRDNVESVVDEDTELSANLDHSMPISLACVEAYRSSRIYCLGQFCNGHCNECSSIQIEFLRRD